MPRVASLRTDTDAGVREIVLTRAERYNTITLELRDELSAALDDADADPDVKVILLRAEGPAFCAGYDLDWSTEAQASADSQRVWDTVADIREIGSFVKVFAKLWDGRKPSVAAVQGWCVAGGTDMVLCADLIVAADDASFGYPPARVWGIPTTAMWVHRLGFQQAKRYLLTGDEIPAAEAVRLGLALEAVPADRLEEHARGLAQRIARLPLNQLVMLKAICNQPAEAGLAEGRRLGMIFDGVARHTQEGIDFVKRAEEVGIRQAVRERDDPFGDYGSRPR
jgi:enoyl-CoA hydratase